jgi:hypothetical protein
MAKTKLHVNDDPTLSDNVSEHYKKFFNKFQEIDTLPIKDWRVVHVLAYLCKKYSAHYGLQYSFKFNNPAPSKSYEVYQIKKLSNMLSSDPQILKDYLDWVFAKKIIEKKKRITALGYFSHVDIVNEFKFKFLLNNKPISRSDSLPAQVSQICVKYGLPTITTYAELAFVKKMPNQDKLFEELRSIDFKVDILDKIA